MQIEQLPPNKPNFLLVVLLALAVMFVFFILAYFFVDFEGGHIHFGRHRPHPTSQILVLPHASSC